MNELGSKEGFRGQGSSTWVGNTLNFKTSGESSNAILLILVEEGGLGRNKTRKRRFSAFEGSCAE